MIPVFGRRWTFGQRWEFGRRRHKPGPSRTSQAVALTRAEFSRPHSPDGDPDAQRRLCRGMRPAGTGDLRPSLAARTRFFDERVLDAIAAGTPQVVVAGAGYDDRALRFRSPGVRFFEIDHPGTQTDKAARLRRAMRPVPPGAGSARSDGPTLVPADFRVDDVAEVLAAGGHDAGRPTLFLCEGLLVYLDQPTCVRLLAALRSRATAGSCLAASLSVHRDGLDSARVAAVANARRRASGAEPWLTILPAEAHLDLLRRAAWRPGAAVDAAELGTGAEPGRSLLVTSEPAS
jgi:methyltransferase (TIGR00027 family)